MSQQHSQGKAHEERRPKSHGGADDGANLGEETKITALVE
jgi:hypothetical protein